MIPRIKQKNSNRLISPFLNALKKNGFDGDLRDSYGDRLAYATDNSIYQVMPAAAVFPKTKADVGVLCRVLNKRQFSTLAVTGRGGGTGTNGQSLTDGIVVDFSKYMNRILKIDYQSQYAVIQPGVVLDALNRQLRQRGFFFAPSVSTANRATIGGMVGTDAAGKGSRIYGKTSDHIINMECVLIDGTVVDTAVRQKSSSGFIEKLYAYLDKIKREKKTEIADRFPAMNRSVTGYNLPEALLASSGINLVKLIAGSEGSLCFITELCVRILPIPPHRAVALMKFPDFLSAIRCAEIIAGSKPDAIETIDDTILSLAMDDDVSEKTSTFFNEYDRTHLKSFNLIEFSGKTDVELKQKTDLFHELVRARQSELNHIGLQLMPYEQSAGLWEMRAKGVGLLANLPGDAKPVAFIEDCAVPPENLQPFIEEFKKILDAHSLDYAMYGHVDVGCMHVRPALDLKRPADERLIRQLTDQVNTLVNRYGGVLWGEHGKGYRGEYAPAFFGKELYAVMRSIKSIFDPNNRMNPGKIATANGAERVELIKIDEVATRGQRDKKINRFYADAFEGAIYCNGNGLCFHHAPDHVMCPSYKENHDRVHSPKGRSGIIREWLSRLSEQSPSRFPDRRSKAGSFFLKIVHGLGKRFGRYDFSHEVYAAMAGCLSCKACTTQCPVKVDVPEQKSLFLDQYHQRYFRPLRDHFVRRTEDLGRVQLIVPRISNFFSAFPPVRFLIEHWIGMRDIPAFSVPVLSKQLKNIPGVFRRYPPVECGEKAVVLIQDAFNLFYDARVIANSARLLTKLGYAVYIPPFMPNGKTAHVRGFLKNFRKIARKNAVYLTKIATSGLPILFVEPSILLTYRQEYRKYLPHQTIPPVLLFQEWLANLADIDGRIQANPADTQKKIGLMLHCTERTSILNAGELWQSVFKKFGVPADIVSAGCCGMAGAFGHETAHFSASKKIYELSWKNAVDQYKDNLLVTGYSCRSQVKRLGGFRPRHPAEFLNRLLEPMSTHCAVPTEK